MKTAFGIHGVALLIAMAGCGRSGGIETARVRGTVTLDGAPYIQGGTVLFQPELAGKMATGIIRSDGSYELTTYSSGDGAAVGMHRIVLLPLKHVTDELTEGRAPIAATISIPRKYGSTATSGLTCDVKSGETNEFSIKLKSE